MHSEQRAAAPAPLKAAASLAAFEAIVMLLLAGAELVNTSGERLLLGVTTTLFFALYGGLLLVASWRVTRGESWGRGPILLAQLMQLAIAWTLREDVGPAIGLALVAVIVLAGMLHPQTLEYLLRDETATEEP